MLPYPAGLDLSTSHLRLLTGLLASHRQMIGSRWRRLSWQGMCVLACLLSTALRASQHLLVCLISQV